MSLLLHAELVDSCLMIYLTRLELGRGELGLVRRIRIVLSLQAEAVVLVVDLAALANIRAVQEVARIELQTGLVGPDFHDAAGPRARDPGGEPYPLAVSIDTKVVVVSAGVFQLDIVLIDTRPDRGGLAEVQRRAGHRGQFTGRDQVDRKSV